MHRALSFGYVASRYVSRGGETRSKPRPILATAVFAVGAKAQTIGCRGGVVLDPGHGESDNSAVRLAPEPVFRAPSPPSVKAIAFSALAGGAVLADAAW
jgi:hypothetical protein